MNKQGKALGSKWLLSHPLLFSLCLSHWIETRDSKRKRTVLLVLSLSRERRASDIQRLLDNQTHWVLLYDDHHGQSVCKLTEPCSKVREVHRHDVRQRESSVFRSWGFELSRSSFRTKLPASMFDRSQISIWSILKQCIGKVRRKRMRDDLDFSWIRSIGIIENHHADCLEWTCLISSAFYWKRSLFASSRSCRRMCGSTDAHAGTWSAVFRCMRFAWFTYRMFLLFSFTHPVCRCVCCLIDCEQHRSYIETIQSPIGRNLRICSVSNARDELSPIELDLLCGLIETIYRFVTSANKWVTTHRSARLLVNRKMEETDGSSTEVFCRKRNSRLKIWKWIPKAYSS